MKAAFLALVTGVMLCFTAAVALAADKDEKPKEVELKGKIACAKCTFKLDKKITGGKCTNAIEVTEKKGDKEVKVIYVIIDDGKEASYHQCSGSKTGTVKGVVSKKKETGDQLYITPVKDGVKLD
jgi:hypothetical protein